MKSILISVISGFIGAALMTHIFQPSYAEQISERAKEMLEEGACNVDVDFGRMTFSPRCYSNEVMTGTEGDYIYCAKIQVTCNQDK